MSITIRCKKCGDIIKSTHVHDFVMCSCRACFIDGGDEYTRIGGWDTDWEYYKENETNEIVAYKTITISTEKSTDSTMERIE